MRQFTQHSVQCKTRLITVNRCVPHLLTAVCALAHLCSMARWGIFADTFCLLTPVDLQVQSEEPESVSSFLLGKSGGV